MLCSSGIADGSRVTFEDILVMNCRTEISMGLMNDGCTSLAWKKNKAMILAQNWDVCAPLLSRTGLSLTYRF